MQNKVDEAEKKYKQVQEQLERITQQVQELQPKCAELKTESQKRNNLLKSSEVRVECTYCSIRWTSDSRLLHFFFFFQISFKKMTVIFVMLVHQLVNI